MQNFDLNLIGREKTLLIEDMLASDAVITEIVSQSRILVLGGAGSIGSAVVMELYKRKAITLYVVDINENNLVELVRDLRRTEVVFKGDLQVYCLDTGELNFQKFLESQASYDYIFNLAAVKHVRSEGNIYTLMRMLKVNIFDNIFLKRYAKTNKIKKLFCVSTDKASNPANLMGASKRLMELYLMSDLNSASVSSARFANVAFSDGSLLAGFENRLKKFQPLVAPYDTKRYFMTKSEAGNLCLLSAFLGKQNEIFVPNVFHKKHLKSFDKIAVEMLKAHNLDAFVCKTKEEAKSFPIEKILKENKWPCFFHKSFSTGEKLQEQFFADDEIVNTDRFLDVGIIKVKQEVSSEEILEVLNEIKLMVETADFNKRHLIKIMRKVILNFEHIETNRNLSEGM